MKQFVSRTIKAIVLLTAILSTSMTQVDALASSDASLDNLMKGWQVSMEQYYYSYTPYNQEYIHDLLLPFELLEHVMINNQPVNMVWYEEGQEVDNATYQVTGVYVESQKNVVYIFTLYQGQPIALMNDQFSYENTADGINFSETANVDLKQRYDQLYRH